MKNSYKVRSRRRSYGFSLIELMIAIAIIGLLLQLFLPAVMSAQESSRQLSCSSNLRQIILASQHHHEAMGHLPTGGWHYRWTGDPHRGTGPEQPGGWIYNILPFIEQGPLHDLGKGTAPGSMEQAQAMQKRISAPVSIFNCPSRRIAKAYPVETPVFYASGGVLRLPIGVGAKSDFAASIGWLSPQADFRLFVMDETWEEPKSTEQADDKSFLWPHDPAFRQQRGVGVDFDGVIYARSAVRFAQIEDGSSHVYLIGEKFLMLDPYDGGKRLPNQELKDKGDNEHMYAGYDNDINRSAAAAPSRDSNDEWRVDQFGSSHPTSWNMGFVDGSVRPMSYDIFLELHHRLASRSDGLDDSIN